MVKSLRDTEWVSIKNDKITGVLYYHKIKTGRCALRRMDGSIYRGTIGDILENWKQAE